VPTSPPPAAAEPVPPGAPPVAEPPLLSGLARNATVQFGARAAGVVAQAIALVIVARRLGPADYGGYALVTSLTQMSAVIADWGLLLVGARAVAVRPAETDRILRTCLALRLGLGLAAVALLVGLAFVASDRGTVHVAGAVAGLSFLVGAPFAVGHIRAQADLRMERVGLALLAGSLASMVWLLVALASGGGLVALAGSFVASSAVSSLVCLALTPGGLPLRPRLDPERWRPLLRESTPVALGLVFVTIYFYVDALLLARLSTPRQLGLYDSAYRFVQLAPLVPTVVVSSVFTLAARLAAEDRARLALFVRELLSVVALLLPLPLLALAFAPGDLIELVYGPAYREAGSLLAILAVGVVLMILSGVAGPLLVTLGRERTTMWLSAAAAIVNVAANCVLIPALDARGAAIATVGTELLVLGVAAAVLRRMLRPRLDGVHLAKVLGAFAAGAALVLVLPGPVLVRVGAGVVAYVALALVTGAAGRRQLELTRAAPGPAGVLG
jgi:O-antigen/teichoic acid export membrane protein